MTASDSFRAHELRLHRLRKPSRQIKGRTLLRQSHPLRHNGLCFDCANRRRSTFHGTIAIACIPARVQPTAKRLELMRNRGSSTSAICCLCGEALLQAAPRIDAPELTPRSAM